jgi:hypothetical protein
MNKLLLMLWGPVYAQGSNWDSRCVGGPDGTVATIQGFECLFQRVLVVASTLAGIAFAAMIVVGGFKLIFAGGEKQAMQSARNTFTYAFVGLVLLILSWFILLLIQEFTGVQVTEFSIPG